MKPIIDIIISWPDNCDFPLWREFIYMNRAMFNKVIISFTKTNQSPTYIDFVKRVFKNYDITFLTAPYPTSPDDDWRDLAVNNALTYCDGNWVWFTEQDFMVTASFVAWACDQIEYNHIDVLAAYEDQGRMHPCCIFAKRDLVESTTKRFGIIPNVSDHFSVFQREIEHKSDIVIKRVPPHLYEHLNGLSSNFTLIENGLNPNYKPEEVAKYIEKCIKLASVLDEHWLSVMSAWYSRHSGIMR